MPKDASGGSAKLRAAEEGKPAVMVGGAGKERRLNEASEAGPSSSIEFEVVVDPSRERLVTLPARFESLLAMADHRVCTNCQQVPRWCLCVSLKLLF